MITHRDARSLGAGSAEVDAKPGERPFDGRGQNPMLGIRNRLFENGWIGDARPITAKTELDFPRLPHCGKASIMEFVAMAHATRRS
jgi:hypothetical protein